MPEDKPPVAFISYSWSSRGYADRVEQIAQDLTSDGVRVLLDQWDLREGQDKHVFMERCVLDPEVSRVLIMIDPRYTDRANRREGGVGTETLIISGEVYAKVDQEKFLGVVLDRDQDGKIALPIYLKDRLYIDLSDPETYTDQYERLLRHIYGKPERTRPPLGKPPSYLDSNAESLLTGRSLPILRTALLQGRPGQVGFLDDYLERFYAAFTTEKVEGAADIAALELAVSDSIDRFRAYRDEFVAMLEFLARHGYRDEMFGRLHALFERMVSFRMSQPQKWSSDVETENLCFITWELFLYTVGTLLRHGRTPTVEHLLRPYYVRSRPESDGTLQQFDVVGSGFALLQSTRQARLGTRWVSGAAHLLQQRTESPETFEMLIEADTVLWVRSMLSGNRQWWPLTAAHRERSGFGGLPVWARAKGDPAYFRELAPVLGVDDTNDAIQKIQRLGHQHYVRIHFLSLDRNTIADLLGVRDRIVQP